MKDRHRWTSSLAIGLGFGALFLLYSLYWMPLVHGERYWSVPGDVWIAVGPAHYVAWGAFPYLYTGNAGYYALPLPAILLSPVVILGHALGLVQGYPFPLRHPTLWLVLEPVLGLSAVVLCHAGRSLMWALGVRRRLWLGQMGLVATVAVPCSAWGHFEDMLAVAGVLYGARLVVARRYPGAALALAVAICCKQWALIGVPFVLVHAPAGERRRVAAYCLVPPLLMAAVPLAFDWHHAIRALLLQTTPPAFSRWHLGPAALLGKGASRVSRALALAASPALALASRRRPVAQVLALAGLAFLLRALLEPLVFAYYFAPGLACLVIATVVVDRRVRVLDLLVAAAAAVWPLPAAHSQPGWWAGEVLLLSWVGVTFWRRSRAPEAAGVSSSALLPQVAA